MLTRKEQLLYLATSLVGLGVWTGISMYSDQPEAWNSELYYGVGVVVMMLTAAWAGYVEPEAPWRWGISIVILQPLALMLMSDAGPLMFVGLLLFGVLAFLCMGAAIMGAGVRRVMDRKNREGPIET